MSHRQYVNLASWKHLASKEPSNDYMDQQIWTIPGFELTFSTSFTKVGRLGAENNCVRHTHSHYVYIYMFNSYYYCFHSKDILKINNCVGLITDFLSLKTIFISFLMMDNLLSYYLII